ncbi:MAG: type II secretion system F family protein [Actinomycetota bacterium]|nr:type II secretion system F family protein [Actinomycetota bacterium]
MLVPVIAGVSALLLLSAVVAALRVSPRRAVRATLRNAAALSGPVALELRRAGHEGTLAERLLAPTIRAIAKPASAVSPPVYRDSVRRRLTLTGRSEQIDLERFLAGRLLSIALVPVAFFLVRLAHLQELFGLLAFVLVAVLLLLGPDALLNRRVADRQERIRSELPGMLELLLISVEAGLGFEQALSRTVESMPGPLADEFSRFLGEVRVGAVRRDALEAIDERTDVAELRSFLLALMQADAFGVSIATILHAQAEEVRVAQRQHVQERAQKAPVKMLFPLVFCVLPALFVVVIGPAAIEIYRTIIK